MRGQGWVQVREPGYAQLPGQTLAREPGSRQKLAGLYGLAWQGSLYGQGWLVGLSELAGLPVLLALVVPVALPAAVLILVLLARPG